MKRSRLTLKFAGDIRLIGHLVRLSPTGEIGILSASGLDDCLSYHQRTSLPVFTFNRFSIALRNENNGDLSRIPFERAHLTLSLYYAVVFRIYLLFLSLLWTNVTLSEGDFATFDARTALPVKSRLSKSLSRPKPASTLNHILSHFRNWHLFQLLYGEDFPLSSAALSSNLEL